MRKVQRAAEDGSDDNQEEEEEEEEEEEVTSHWEMEEPGAYTKLKFTMKV